MIKQLSQILTRVEEQEKINIRIGFLLSILKNIMDIWSEGREGEDIFFTKLNLNYVRTQSEVDSMPLKRKVKEGLLSKIRSMRDGEVYLLKITQRRQMIIVQLF